MNAQEYEVMLTIGNAQLDEAMRQARDLAVLRMNCDASATCRGDHHLPICRSLDEQLDEARVVTRPAVTGDRRGL